MGFAPYCIARNRGVFRSSGVQISLSRSTFISMSMPQQKHWRVMRDVVFLAAAMLGDAVFWDENAWSFGECFPTFQRIRVPSYLRSRSI